MEQKLLKWEDNLSWCVEQFVTNFCRIWKAKGELGWKKRIRVETRRAFSSVPRSAFILGAFPFTWLAFPPRKGRCDSVTAPLSNVPLATPTTSTLQPAFPSQSSIFVQLYNTGEALVNQTWFFSPGSGFFSTPCITVCTTLWQFPQVKLSFEPPGP